MPARHPSSHPAPPAPISVFVTNNGNNSVEEISNGVTSAFIAPTTNLNGPTGLAFNSVGDLFVANNGSGDIAEFSPSGTFLKHFASGLSNPRGLAFDSAGNLWVANQSRSSVEEFNPAGTLVSANTVTSGMNFPNALAFDNAGNLYVTNGQGNSIVKISISGGLVSGVTSIVSTGLNSPNGIVYDTVGKNTGDLFVVDHNSSSVLEYTAAGVPVGSHPFIANTSVSALNQPKTIAVDSAGDFYVTDYGDNSVTEYNSSGVLIHVYNSAGAFNLPCSVVTETVVPEPAAYALMSAALALLFILARRKTAKGFACQLS